MPPWPRRKETLLLQLRLFHPDQRSWNARCYQQPEITLNTNDKCSKELQFIQLLQRSKIHQPVHGMQSNQRPPGLGTLTGPTIVHDRFNSTNTSLSTA
jgi:hypothetical protein